MNHKIHRLISCVFGLTSLFIANATAQNAPPASLATEYVFTIEAKIGTTYSMGKTVDGTRQSIAITGGSFYGDSIKGEVIPGGADYQLTRSDGTTRLHAIYMIKTDDGALINVDNVGLIVPESADTPFYFRTSPRFTAPNGKYSWLNQNIFVAGVRFDPAKANTVLIDVYQLK